MSDAPASTKPTWTYWAEPSTIEADGLTTAYRRDGAGEPILFLHGTGFTRQWLPIHRKLAGNADVIAPDLPGFGATELPGEFEDFSDYVLHLDAFLDALGIHRAHLVGHGLGARIAAHLAAVYPSRFASLTLIAPTGLRVEGVRLVDAFRLSPRRHGSRSSTGARATTPTPSSSRASPATRSRTTRSPPPTPCSRGPTASTASSSGAPAASSLPRSSSPPRRIATPVRAPRPDTPS
ncbi:alpha/beta fold hydrolase [Leucobacter soli]|uniref:alpha/beta fold hydrolase n=1 Tax=Leucobacter soli TaxID=2812850 RepID=UPI00361A69BA